MCVLKVKTAVLGVGNLCSAFIQGIQYYRSGGRRGLTHEYIGGLTPGDIEVVSAFDVDKRKVGKKLGHAIFQEPNNSPKIVEVESDVVVEKGAMKDDPPSVIKPYLTGETDAGLANVLRGRNVEICINMTPSFAYKSTRYYAVECLKAKCAFINATPVPVVNDREIADLYEREKIPLVGDDLMDQIGSTILHRELLRLLNKRKSFVEETYQLDVGGGTESLWTLEKSRMLKREVKSKAIKSVLPRETRVVAGSMDYVDFLGDRRASYLWFKGYTFGGIPYVMDLKYNGPDSFSGASILYDVVRAVKIALQRRIGGVLETVSAYGFKNPPRHITSVENIYSAFYDFIEGIINK